jgi:hypothetical protein
MRALEIKCSVPHPLLAMTGGHSHGLPPMTSAIIVAAGSSRRMGFNKLLAPLAGIPVLRRTLGQFQACEDVGGRR